MDSEGVLLYGPWGGRGGQGRIARGKGGGAVLPLNVGGVLPPSLLGGDGSAHIAPGGWGGVVWLG